MVFKKDSEKNKEKKEEKLQSWEELLKIKSTEEVIIPKRIIDQVIGQDKAVEIIKKAAKQRRHVLLIGEPGTGKSLLAKGLAELLPNTNLSDILVYPNPDDENNPKIQEVNACEGKKIIQRYKLMNQPIKTNNFAALIVSFIILSIPWILRPYVGDIMAAAMLITSSLLVFLIFFSFAAMQKLNLPQQKILAPKLLINNCGKTKAPFVDATGAHEGALLGDVLHDPLQSFYFGDLAVIKEVDKEKNQEKVKITKIGEFIDYLLSKYKDKIIKKNYNNFTYIGLSLEDANIEYYTLTLKEGKKEWTKIKAVNKRLGKFKILPVTVEDKILFLTPEHKIFSEKGLIEAQDYKRERLFKSEFELLNEKDIAELYNEKDKLKNYKKFVEFRKNNPTIGYKKAAKILGIKESTLRWWYEGAKPNCVKTIEVLKENDLLPLKTENSKLPIIARLFGFALGDGNIDINLNNLSFISSKREVLENILSDLKSTFKKLNLKWEIIKNNTSYGDSFILRIFNREIIRFFVALGYPIGKKSEQEIKIPEFVLVRKDTIIEFLKGLFEADGSVYSFGNKTWLEGTLSYNITCKKNEKLIKNRTRFLNEIKFLLESLGIKVGSISIVEKEDSYIFKLLLSHKPENIKKFIKLFRLNYEKDKQEKLLKGFDYLKRVRNNLFKNQVSLADPFVEETYNITTSTGNLLVNTILVKNSGGLGTPAHERVIPGAIHKAHKGVLFIDEIATLSIEMQQDLLTAMQEKKMPITGRSERSSGAMVRTDPVPCDFILVAAGNLDALQKMHPALRSRIIGEGYEVFMEDEMEDTPENRAKLIRFVAQEVKRDGRIPHFTIEAVQEIINEARRRAMRGKLTLRLRELSGLVKVAGDIAIEKGHKLVQKEDVLEALKLAKTVEEQIADKMIEVKKEYQLIKNKGYEIGRVNGLAVIGRKAGIVLPIEAEVVPATGEPKVIATGKLGEIAKEAVQNVSAVIKKMFGDDLKNYDIHIQFLQTYEGVEGDSASITIATAILSALKNLKVRQDFAMTGSLSIRGEVLPIGGVNQKIRAAYEAGIKNVIIPKMNEKDLNLEEEIKKKINIYTVEKIEEVWELVLKDFKDLKKEKKTRKTKKTKHLSK